MIINNSRIVIAILITFMIAENSTALAVDSGMTDRTSRYPRLTKNWFIRFKVKAPEQGLIDQNSMLGQLSKRTAAMQHSLKALTPFSGRYLYLSFDNPQGVENTGEYKTSFHRRTRKSHRKDHWDFTVKSSDPLNDIILSWSDVHVLEPFDDQQGRTRYKDHRVINHRLINRMKLIDRDTQEEIPMVFNHELQQYSFSMEGAKERHFTWVLDRRIWRDRRDVYANEYADRQGKVLSDSVRLRSTNPLTEVVIDDIWQHTFDLGKPPQIQRDDRDGGNLNAVW